MGKRSGREAKLFEFAAEALSFVPEPLVFVAKIDRFVAEELALVVQILALMAEPVIRRAKTFLVLQRLHQFAFDFKDAVFGGHEHGTNHERIATSDSFFNIQQHFHQKPGHDPPWGRTEDPSGPAPPSNGNPCVEHTTSG